MEKESTIINITDSENIRLDINIDKSEEELKEEPEVSEEEYQQKDEEELSSELSDITSDEMVSEKEEDLEELAKMFSDYEMSYLQENNQFIPEEDKSSAVMGLNVEALRRMWKRVKEKYVAFNTIINRVDSDITIVELSDSDYIRGDFCNHTFKPDNLISLYNTLCSNFIETIGYNSNNIQELYNRWKTNEDEYNKIIYDKAYMELNIDNTCKSFKGDLVGFIYNDRFSKATKDHYEDAVNFIRNIKSYESVNKDLYDSLCRIFKYSISKLYNTKCPYKSTIDFNICIKSLEVCTIIYVEYLLLLKRKLDQCFDMIYQFRMAEATKTLEENSFLYDIKFK